METPITYMQSEAGDYCFYGTWDDAPFAGRWPAEHALEEIRTEQRIQERANRGLTKEYVNQIIQQCLGVDKEAADKMMKGMLRNGDLFTPGKQSIRVAP